jgi:hypothetical protein
MTATQLVNPEIDRVDAVNGPATGLPFLMFKNLDGAPVEAPAEVAKAADDAEDLAEEAAEADAPNIDGTPVTADDVALAEPGDPAWEAVDAAKARVAVAGLAVLQKLIAELAKREGAEGDDLDNEFDLMDAGAAVDFALGVLARFSVTEQLEADEAVAKAQAILKALHLEVHEKPEEEAPADHEAPAAPEHHEAPAEAPHEPVAPAVKADEPLPSGLQEILDTFVESYAKYKEAQDSGAEAQVAEDSAEEDALNAPAEHAPAKPAPAAAPEAAEPAPAAPETHPAPPAAAHEEPAAEEEDPAKKVAKSMDELIAEAVSKAVEEATAPLLKQIDVLERTPEDSGPMFAGQTPGSAGNPLVRGQEGGVVAKGLSESAAAQAAPGMLGLANALKGVYTGAQ